MSTEPDNQMVDGPAPGHARLSPSAAERWTECPASIAMEASVPRPPESSYAREGTAAHALGELKARYEILGELDERAYDDERQAWRDEYADVVPSYEVEQEMDEHTDVYLDLIRERAAREPNSVVMLEQRVPTGVPESWGTSDTVIVSPVHVEVIDLKYGAGVHVSAWENPQLKLYGVGALEAFGDLLGEVDTVYMTVFQPRLENQSTFDMPATELRAWRDSIIPIAEEALGEDARFGPSEDACRWCPASGMCAAQLEQATQADFGTEVGKLTPEELADALDQVPFVKVWLSALEAAALDLTYSKGVSIPRYKVVQSGGQRYFSDADGAIEALEMLGHDHDEIMAEPKLKGLGALEKLLGKKQFAAVMEPYLDKSTGKPSLVPEDDKRPAMSPDAEAAKEFGA